MPIKMNLQKASNKIVMNLEKQGIRKEDIPLMAVFESVDCSGSMDDLYSSGWVDELLVVAGGAALTFDDNKSLQVAFFNHMLNDNVPEIDESTNLENYLRDNRISAYGGTTFSPTLKWFINTDASGYDDQVVRHVKEVESKSAFKRFFGMKDKVVTEEHIGDKPDDLPKLLLMVTDGACAMQDRDVTLNFLNKLPDDHFVFFIGLGQQFEERFIKDICSSSNNCTYFWAKNPTEISANDMLDSFTNDDKFVSFVKTHK